MKFKLLTLTLLLSFLTKLAAQQSFVSEKDFKTPPQKYGIRCWWWWLNGNVTKEAITRDLHEMKAKGFSGACIFDAGGHNQRGNGDIPEGPMFGTPQWRELYLHAINEAEKLGLEMSLSIQSGWNLGGPDITPEEAAKQVVSSEIRIKGGQKVSIPLPQPPSRLDFYRDIVVLAFPYKEIKDRKPIKDFANKAATREVGWSVPETRPLLVDIPATEGEEDASLENVQNLTNNYKNGILEWNAPEGDWVVLRMGYSPTDAEVSTSSGKWQGHVIDYMSEKHFNRYWETHVEPLLKMIGNRAGKTLKYLQTDSFEAGGMNWSDKFEEEFKKRRGYDPLPYLPILAGKIIENREVSNRFLNDLRKTLGDCISDNHYRVFAARAAKYNMGIQPESAGPHAGPFDGLKNYGHSTIMMSEFWSPSPHRSKDIDRFFVKQAASAAKIFDKTLVGAESFTTIGPHWNDVIWADMKPSADHEFCAGLNLIYLHTFTCSPKEMGLPGQEYFAGTHFNPNITWWDYSTGFITYLSRCQSLLQQGKSVADVLYYYGDHVPNLGRFKDDDPAKSLPSYDYDLVNEDKLLELTAKNGKIYLPSGVSYQLLALPNHKILSLAALRKVKELVEKGITVIGEKPASTASLVGGMAAEKEREQIINQIWDKISNKTAKEILKEKGILPDCEIIAMDKNLKFDYIHRQAAGIDLYFISNQNKQAQTISAAFRILGKQPELWNAVTGEISPITDFYETNGQTFVQLTFNPNGSAFVVFRKSISAKTRKHEFKSIKTYETLQSIKGEWEVSFDPKWGGSTIKMDKLISWTDVLNDGIKYYSGKAVYRTKFNFGGVKKQLYLELDDIKDVGVAKIKLNGKDLGIVWCPPFRVSVDGVLKNGNNDLEIEIVNSWRNRLVGDRGKPQNERFMQTNITIKPEWQLLPSGIIGEVKIIKEK